jgi:hypothetical protein
MAYFKGVLATFATLFLAVLIPMFWTAFRGISSEKGTGLAAIAGGLTESIFSPWFWILAVAFSVFFYFSARLKNAALRILLFWIPTITVPLVVLGFWALIEVLILRSGRG